MNTQSSGRTLVVVLLAVALVAVLIAYGGAGVALTMASRASVERQRAIAMEMRARAQAEMAKLQEMEAREAEAAARDRAEQARQESLTERQRADEAQAKADAVAKFLADMLVSGDPKAQGAPVKDMLDRAAAAADKQFKDQPLAEASLRLSIGRSLLSLGEFGAAEGQLLKAHAAREAQAGPKSDAAIEAAKALVGLYDAWDKAEPGKGYADKAAEWRTRAGD